LDTLSIADANDRCQHWVADIHDDLTMGGTEQGKQIPFLYLSNFQLYFLILSLQIKLVKCTANCALSLN